MFINFWYAAGWAEDVGQDPVKVRMLSHDFVLFRDEEGAAHCLSNTCVHRGGSLAQGKVLGNCIQCPYHGWQFDTGGVCRKVPSLGAGAKPPPRAQVDAYPIQERYGLIFVFLGDLPEAERPPIMPIDEWGQEGWRSTELDYEWRANYERSVENSLDPAHNEFVHPSHGFSGANEDYKVPDFEPEEHEWGFSFMMKFRSSAGKGKESMKKERGEGTTEAGTGHMGPSQMWTHIHFTPTNWMHQYIYETPISETHTKIYLINLRNGMLGPEMDDRISKGNLVIAEQDRVVIEALEPPITPTSLARETLVPADKVIVRYRERLMEWQQCGWRIDVDALNAKGEDIVFAIPSPARHEHRRWALHPVPLLSSE
jgi:phenylpropionate dioxygenase-like ring-hydroxylating dioxygenase large terminal subunit